MSEVFRMSHRQRMDTPDSSRPRQCRTGTSDGPVDRPEPDRLLLEAAGAESYRVRAFRRAAAAVNDAGPDRVAELSRSGRLQSLEGVGNTTATGGRRGPRRRHPSYLADLEDQNRLGARRAGRARIRALLQGDCQQALGLV